MGEMYTYSGARFDPLKPDPSLIRLEDIAHALANTCRYAGHCKSFYSVAQHCVLMTAHCPDPWLRPYCLMHDAAEAYLGDVPRPLKHMLFMREYVEAEDRLLRVIFDTFGLTQDLPDAVRWWDEWMLAWEQRDLMPQSHVDGEWFPQYDPPIKPLASWSAEQSKRMFLESFDRVVRPLSARKVAA